MVRLRCEHRQGIVGQHNALDHDFYLMPGTVICARAAACACCKFDLTGPAIQATNHQALWLQTTLAKPDAPAQARRDEAQAERLGITVEEVAQLRAALAAQLAAGVPLDAKRCIRRLLPRDGRRCDADFRPLADFSGGHRVCRKCRIGENQVRPLLAQGLCASCCMRLLQV